MRNWTEEEENKVRLMAEKGASTEEISIALSRSYKSISHRRAELMRGTLKFVKNIETPKSFIQTNKDLIYELKQTLANITPMKTKRNKKFSKVGDTLMIHFTDWHVGKLIKDEFGNEIYNVKVFELRINKLLNEILRLLDDNIRKGTPIKDAVIMSTGDILDGMGIYASQETQSELSPPFQVMLAVEVIQKFILSLLKRKLNVKFYGVKGNHGEIREGGKSKDPNANWDLQLYLILDFWCKTMLKNDKVQIYYSELDYFNFEVQEWKYHIRHIAPKQSETPSGKAKFLGWARKHKCEVLVYGHYHHWGINDRSGITVIRGGSVCGEGELSERMGEESEPIQLMWGASKNRPVTFMYAMDLGKRNKK